MTEPHNYTQIRLLPEGKARQEQLWTAIVVCSVWAQTHPLQSQWSQQRQARLERSPVISPGVLLTGQVWACSGLGSVVWPAQVWSKATLFQEGFGDCQRHAIQRRRGVVEAPHFMMVEGHLGAPLEKVLVLPLSYIPRCSELVPSTCSLKLPWN